MTHHTLRESLPLSSLPQNFSKSKALFHRQISLQITHRAIHINIFIKHMTSSLIKQIIHTILSILRHLYLTKEYRFQKTRLSFQTGSVYKVPSHRQYLSSTPMHRVLMHLSILQIDSYSSCVFMS